MLAVWRADLCFWRQVLIVLVLVLEWYAIFRRGEEEIRTRWKWIRETLCAPITPHRFGGEPHYAWNLPIAGDVLRHVSRLPKRVAAVKGYEKPSVLNASNPGRRVLTTRNTRSWFRASAHARANDTECNAPPIV